MEGEKPQRGLEWQVVGMEKLNTEKEVKESFLPQRELPGYGAKCSTMEKATSLK